MAALVLVGLAVSFVGCQKENQVETKTESIQNGVTLLSEQHPGLKHTWVSKADIPAMHLKSYSIVTKNIIGVGYCAIVTNGSKVTTWKCNYSGPSTRAQALAKGVGGWRVPSNTDFQDLYFACWYAGIGVNEALGFYNYEGLWVTYPGQAEQQIFTGSGYFWLSDLITPQPNYTYLLGVNKPDDTFGTCQCQVPARAYVYLVK